MRYQLTVPARINILGNPSDANEGDFATITAASVFLLMLIMSWNSKNLKNGPRLFFFQRILEKKILE